MLFRSLQLCCFAFQLQPFVFPLGCAGVIFSALHLVFHLFPPKQEEIITVFHMHIISNPSDKLLI